MKRTIVIVGLLCLSATGCQTPNQANGAVTGGIAGGLLGLGVGALTRNPAAGLAIGAGSGALIGNAVGANKDRQDAKAAAAYANAHMMSVADVVSLSAQRVPDDQIIRQIISTNSWFNLNPNADLPYLNQNGVSPAVIAVMQQRSGPQPPVVVGPPPPVVYGPAYAPPVGVGVVVPVR
jgi:hypothetical protein